MLLNILFLVSVLFSVSSAASNTEFLTKCKLNDRKCTTKAGSLAWPIVAEGIPALGIAPSEPLHLKSIDSDHAGLQLQFKDAVVTGLKTCNINDVLIDILNTKFRFEIACKLLVVGQYNISGRVLVLPVTGNGDFKIDLQKLKVKLEGDLVRKTEPEPYWNIARFQHNTTVEAPIVFKFNNLFGGNKQLSDPLHDFVNSNYKEVLGELGQPILDIIYKKVMKTANKFLRVLPEAEYFLL